MKLFVPNLPLSFINSLKNLLLPCLLMIACKPLRTTTNNWNNWISHFQKKIQEKKFVLLSQSRNITALYEDEVICLFAHEGGNHKQNSKSYIEHFAESISDSCFACILCVFWLVGTPARSYFRKLFIFRKMFETYEHTNIQHL